MWICFGMIFGRTTPRSRLWISIFYDVGAFNQCENNNCVLMAVENWRYVHPLLKILPVDWGYTIPFGLLHSLTPSPMVEQFLKAVEKTMAQG